VSFSYHIPLPDYLTICIKVVTKFISNCPCISIISITTLLNEVNKTTISRCSSQFCPVLEVVENVFGIFASRFGIFQRPLSFDPDKVTTFCIGFMCIAQLVTVKNIFKKVSVPTSEWLRWRNIQIARMKMSQMNLPKVRHRRSQ
jgi:hypothetical protein